MAGLRVSHELSQRIKIPLIACSVIVFANVALADRWVVDDLQADSDPDFEYKAKVYKIVNGFPDWIEDQDYVYQGEVEYNYAWTLGPFYYYIQHDDLVWVEVYNRYGGSGSWYLVDSFYAEWE